MSVTTEIEFSCDAPGCERSQHEPPIHSSEGRELPRCPPNWLTDMTYRFHACSAEHATLVGDWFLKENGRRLLWLTFREAPLTR